MPSTPSSAARFVSATISSIEPRSRHGWPTIWPTYGKNFTPVPARISCTRLDQRAADQVVGPDLGRHAGGRERRLVASRRRPRDRRCGRCARMSSISAASSSRGKPDVLAADVADARVGDRGVDLARVGQRDVVAREHEDELDHRPHFHKLSDNSVYSSTARTRTLAERGGAVRAAIWDGPGTHGGGHRAGRRRARGRRAAARARLRHLRHRRALVLQRRPPDRAALGARPRDQRRGGRDRPSARRDRGRR